EGLGILPLLLIRRKPILSKDDVIPHGHSQQPSSARRYFSPTHPGSFIQTHNCTGLLRYRARVVQTSHLDLSTNSSSLSVKWKTPFMHACTYFIPPPKRAGSQQRLNRMHEPLSLLFFLLAYVP